MKISIITACYNSEKTIEDTILSIEGQKAPQIEHIIIDGGSTDRTLEIIEFYEEKISRVISEPDNGIYDAMNKGISITSGDIIGILNSDDVYADNKVFFPGRRAQEKAACFSGLNSKNIAKRLAVFSPHACRVVAGSEAWSRGKRSVLVCGCRANIVSGWLIKKQSELKI